MKAATDAGTSACQSLPPAMRERTALADSPRNG